MGFFSELKQKWKTMPTGEKVKLIINGICDVGACFLTDMLSKKLYSDQPCGRLKRITTNVTLTGCGMWAGSVASKQLGSVVDALYISPETQEEEDDE